MVDNRRVALIFYKLEGFVATEVEDGNWLTLLMVQKMLGSLTIQIENKKTGQNIKKESLIKEAFIDVMYKI